VHGIHVLITSVVPKVSSLIYNKTQYNKSDYTVSQKNAHFFHMTVVFTNVDRFLLYLAHSILS